MVTDTTVLVLVVLARDWSSFPITKYPNYSTKFLEMCIGKYMKKKVWGMADVRESAVRHATDYTPRNLYTGRSLERRHLLAHEAGKVNGKLTAIYLRSGYGIYHFGCSFVTLKTRGLPKTETEQPFKKKRTTRDYKN